jgi:uncharacterized hydantoinase/oxoprolinase family protein
VTGYAEHAADEARRMRSAMLGMHKKIDSLERALRQIADEATEDRIGALAELALLADASDPRAKEFADRMMKRVSRTPSPSPRKEDNATPTN